VVLVITPEARQDFTALPVGIQERVRGLTERMLKWPDVSGAKPLRGKCMRIET